MRIFGFFACLLMTPHLFQVSSDITKLGVNEMIFYGTDVTLNEGNGVDASGHFISFVDSSNKLWFFCFDAANCRYDIGFDDKSKKISVHSGSLVTNNISNLDVYLHRSTASMTETLSLNLVSYSSPVILKPRNGSRLNISQQNDDLSLILTSPNWELVTDSWKDFEKHSLNPTSANTNIGVANIQILNGQLNVSETLVSLNTH